MSAPFPHQYLPTAKMPDERSPLLQNGLEQDDEIDYLAVNEPEQHPIHASGSTDTEQQQTVAPPQNFSVLTLVRLSDFRDYVLNSRSNTSFSQR